MTNFATGMLGPTRIGQLNRARVLHALCAYGPLTRAELARMAGVTRATIGNVVQSLIDGRLVEEVDGTRAPNGVGKSGRPIWFSPSAGLSAALSLGPTQLGAALVNARGEQLRSTVVPIRARATAQSMVSTFADVVHDIVRRSRVLGVGLAVPGICNPVEHLVVSSASMPALEGFPLGEALGDRLGMRVLLDSRTRIEGLAERWFGQARGLADVVTVHTGDSLGAGLLVGGLSYRGTDGAAGEIGHTCIDPKGDICRCGRRGCWETVATLRWLRRRAAERKILRADELDAATLAENARSGSERHRALLEEFADNLALGLANLMQLLTPELIVLNGDVVSGGETLREEIERRTRQRCQPHIAARVKIAFSELGASAPLLGAAGLVLSEEFRAVS